MNSLKFIVALILISAAAGVGFFQLRVLLENQSKIEPEAGMEADMARMAEAAALQRPPPSYEGSSASGSYLSGRFAQRHHDWNRAGRYMDYVLKKSPDDPELMKRAMVLALGAGDYERSFEFARKIVKDHENDNSLSHMFLTADAFRKTDYPAAQNHIESMPEGGLSNFIMPLLQGWANASLGQYDVSALRTNSIHLYHAILISEYMGKTGAIKDMLQQALAAGDLDVQDLERIADIYAHLGETENAVTLYEQALIADPENSSLHPKYEAAKSGEKSDIFIRVQSPEQGVAEAFYDMARLLSQDYSDESARVFARLSVHVDPALVKAKFLLAQIAARNERYDEAIAIFDSVDTESDGYLKAQREAADILHEQGRSAEAVAALENLYRNYDDLDSLIQIGNVHRIDGDFNDAIKAYDKAFDKIGVISKDYWHLYYVRGMSHEQAGNWPKAETDLKKALEFKPDHPYILNYLGYAWADQDLNLEEALTMIERAAELRPGDGYITDSLGWVYYRMGRYGDAIPYLEQAVELMPYDPVINDHLGDVYWKVGRHLEAEFQWRRAKNHTEDTELMASIENKLINGLDLQEDVKEAHSMTPAVDMNKTAQENAAQNTTEVQ